MLLDNNHLNEGTVLFEKQKCQAVVANLADVGIKEFLVKDWKQILRLSIPLRRNQHFEEISTTSELKKAQESLELVKLRFEQVGYSNPVAWGMQI